MPATFPRLMGPSPSCLRANSFSVSLPTSRKPQSGPCCGKLCGGVLPVTTRLRRLDRQASRSYAIHRREGDPEPARGESQSMTIREGEGYRSAFAKFREQLESRRYEDREKAACEAPGVNRSEEHTSELQSPMD